MGDRGRLKAIKLIKDVVDGGISDKMIDIVVLCS